jgi:hypothetical protein
MTLSLTRIKFAAPDDDLVIDPETVFTATTLDGALAQILSHLEPLAAGRATDQQ